MKQFVGNSDSVAKLARWLNEYFNSKANWTKSYAVVYGDSGNGKTSLVYYLADKFNVDVYRITSDDSTNINQCLKSLNLQRLGGKLKKIVLVDDINEFGNHKNVLYNIDNICNYPIIYTNNKYPPEELRNGILIEIKKPRSSQLFNYLKHHQQETGIGKNLDDNIIRKLAEDSISFRSAVNSLYTGYVSENITPCLNISGEKKALPRRALSVDMDYGLLNVFLKNMKCYSDDEFKVFNRFVLFEAEMKSKFKSFIDSYLVNNMLEPIEKISWFKPEPAKKKIKVKNQKKPKPKVKVVEKPAVSSIADFY